MGGLRKNRLLWLATGLLMFGQAWATQQVSSGEHKSSVVELYTSEGCDSCPPADEFLARLGRTQEGDRIIPLAFHVDYWDYIGWKDPYAKPEFTQRQREIARINGQSTIYTPEFVVDGLEARGSRQIGNQVTRTQASRSEADLVLQLSDIVNDTLSAEVSVDNISADVSGGAVLYLAVYENALSSSINAGENRGRTLEHDYVVRYLSPPRDTRSGQRHSFELQLDSAWKRESLGVAVFVKRAKDGLTLQAVKASL